MNWVDRNLSSVAKLRLVLGALSPVFAVGSAVVYHLDDSSLLVAGGLAGCAIMAAAACGLVHLCRGSELDMERVFSLATMHQEDLIVVTNPDGQQVFSNTAFDLAFPGRKGMPGIRAAAEELETYAELDRLCAEIAGGQYAKGDVRLAHADGTQRWWRIRALPGNNIQTVWVLEDLSLDRQERDQHQSDARTITDFLDNLPVGFFALDSDGQFVYANVRFARWVGHAPDQLVRDDVQLNELLAGDKEPPDDGVGYVTFSDGAGETFRAYVIRNRRESSSMGGTRAVVLRDPGSSEDAKDEADNSAHARLPDWLFGDAPVGIAILSEQGAVEHCNTALCRFLGVPPDSLVGNSIVSFISAEDQDDYGAALSKLVMGTSSAAHVEARFQSDKSAEERAASLFVTRINDEGGMVLHVIDETEHKHLELQFTQSQKMQAVGQLAGGVAHDFNNLLTAMIGFSDLLLERHGPDDASFADIMQIKQNANRATNLVRQLLAFSRKQTLEPVILDPTEMLGDLSHLLGRLIGERVELMFEHAPDAYLVRADRGQFDQVIINLAVNARDAMPGGGTLTVRTRNETVTTSIQRGPDVMPPGAYVVISVSDTGTGISRENIDRIFEPFFSTKEVGAGTGLGLSTVYGIIRQSEGFIYVESAMGHGTTFHIYLPASGSEGEVGVQAAARAVDKARIEHRSTQGNDRAKDAAADLTGSGVILLVEDEDAVRLFGGRALRNKGYTVLEADNGETALDELNAADQPIDLIVSDVVMPGMDGHTFVQLVRQEMPDMRVILMSGYTEEVFREEISRDPTIHFLAKPFSLKTLAGTVKDVMEG